MPLPNNPIAPPVVAATQQAAAAQQSPLVPQGQSQNVQQNISQWEEVLRKLTEPGPTSALTALGAQLLQPRAPGQSTAGHVGASLMGTVQQQRVLQERKAKGAAATRKEGREERRLGLEERKTKTAEDAEARQKDYYTEKLKIEREKLKQGTQTREAADVQKGRIFEEWLKEKNPEMSDAEAAAQGLRMAQSVQTKDKTTFLAEIYADLASDGLLDSGEIAQRIDEARAFWDQENTGSSVPAPSPEGAPAGTTPASESAADPAAGVFNELPPAEQYAGKVITNPQTGERLRSDGTQWLPADRPTTRKGRRENR